MSSKKIKIFIIAGEVSGDVLGAKIMREMPNAQFIGIGGENMQAAGLKSLFSISDLAVMGFVEVLAHARTLTSRIDQTVDAIIQQKPDVVLTIDSPGFAKRVVKKVREISASNGSKRNILPRFYHVVAPQVWAWGAKRAKKYADTFDRLYAFFDFEKPYFTEYGLETVVIGHPIADGLIDRVKSDHSEKQDNKIIALIPGSRMSEVKKLLPVFRKVTETLAGNPDFKFVIPTVETTRDYITDQIQKWTVKPELIPSCQRYDLYENTYIAIAASGTVSAELAIMHIPTIVVYKMNPVTMWMAKFAVKIQWVSLVNILQQKGIYPELLGPDATPEKIIEQVHRLSKSSERKKMIQDLTAVDKKWRRYKNKTASAVIAENITDSFA